MSFVLHTRRFWLVCGVVFLPLSVHAATVCDPCVYVANQSSNSVTVIDGATNNVVLNIPAGQTPQFLAVHPSGTRVYVSTHGDGQVGLVSVIDTGSYTIIANVVVGRNPTGLVVNPTGTRLYVLNSGDNTMSIIDTSTNTVVGAPVPVAAGPYDVVVSPRGTRLYVSAQTAHAVQVLDTATNSQVGALIPVGQAPAGLAQNATGTRLYVADFVKSNVTVIDTASLAVVGTVPAGSGAIALALAPNGNRLYSANFGFGRGNTVSVINTTTNTIAATITVGTSPHGIAMNAAGTAVYVTNQGSHDVSIIDPSNNTVIAKVRVDASPVGVAVVYAGSTTPPVVPPHIASAVNGRPRFSPGGTTAVAPGDTIEFTVRVPNIAPGTPASVRYHLSPNLRFLRASAGIQRTGVCQPAMPTAPFPNGVQGDAQLLTCSLTDGSKPLLITATVAGSQAPRDDPFAATACLPTAFTNCVPVRVAIQFPPGAVPTIGPQRTAIILVSAPGAPLHPYADKTATASVFYASANPRSARSYFAQASYGLMTIVGNNPMAEGSAADVYGPYTTPNTSCAFDAIALADPDIDYKKYERIVVVTNSAACGTGGGYAVTSPVTYNTGEGARPLTVATLYGLAFGETTLLGRIGHALLHEYGHTLGMEHAGAWSCGSASVAANGCFGNGYLEPIDLVSQASMYAHPNSVHKERLGWLEGGRILPIWTSGTYTINAYEDGQENTKVLKIPRKVKAAGASGSPVIGYYYLSYRRPLPPWDGWLANSPAFANGVAIHMDERGGLFETALLDATPGSLTGLSDINDAALLAGQTFTDALAAVSITVIAVTSTTATVSITLQPRTTRFVQAAVEAQTNTNWTPATVGTVTGGGSFASGQSVTLSASPQPGWGFYGWFSYSGPAAQQVSSANPFVFTIGDDRVLWAFFIPAPPPNDNFAAAAAVTTLPSQYTLFTAGARYEVGEPFPMGVCGGGGNGRGATIWYTYTPTTNQRITIDTAGSSNTADIAVYTGSVLTALAPVANGCSVGAGGQTPHVTFSALAGTTYRIQIDTVGGDTVVTFASAPANDDSTAATQVGALPAQYAVLMRGASVQSSEPIPPCGPPQVGLSVWYVYTATAFTSLKVSATFSGVQSSNTAPIVAVYTRPGLGNLTPVPGACNWPPNSGQPQLTVAVTAGTTYWIQIGQIRGQFIDPTKVTTIMFQ